MALTLLEAAKLSATEGNFKQAGVIRQYAESSGVLENIPFQTIPGNSISYNVQETMPGIGFRGYNQAFSESTGIVNPQTETLAIAGGDLDVDMKLIQHFGEDIRATQEMLKVDSLSLAWTNTFINGDRSTNPLEFDGIKRRIVGSQLVANGSSSGGDVLSLTALDRTKRQVQSPTHWIMNEEMALRLTAAARNTSVGGFITYSMDEFGREVIRYAGLPIITLREDNNRNEILPFTEAAPGGGTNQSTSIYCVSFREMMLQGIQDGVIDVRDLGELSDRPVLRTRVEWGCGIMAMNPRCMARLYGVKNGAVVA